MPWCEPCQHYYAPSAMTPEGHCPRCGNDLLAPDPEPVEGEDRASEDAGSEGVPWHFKLMVVLLVIYLGWRFVQLVTGQL
jgi:hypothetical protein